MIRFIPAMILGFFLWALMLGIALSIWDWAKRGIVW